MIFHGLVVAALVQEQPKSTDAVQTCCLGVSGVAGVWRDCDFNQPETYLDDRTDHSSF
jgi:hypothetical protein